MFVGLGSGVYLLVGTGTGPDIRAAGATIRIPVLPVVSALPASTSKLNLVPVPVVCTTLKYLLKTVIESTCTTTCSTSTGTGVA